MKQFYFLSGLPRSGSTLLTSILSQNPAIYASPNSPLVELLVNVRNHLRTTEQARAFLEPRQEKDVLLSIMDGFYRFSDAQNILDKSRAWPHPHNIELLRDILPEPPKFVAVVRDLPSALASFITLIEAHPEAQSFVDRELEKRGLPLTTANRCELLFSPQGTVHEAWYTLKMAFDAGYENLFHVVEYDELCAHPRETVEGVYRFLGIEPYSHNFSSIVNKTPEDDAVYSLPGLHEVRPAVKKISKDPKAVLGPELFARYAGVPHFWRQKNAMTRPQENPFTLRI
jgi:sulfotransferase